MANFYEKGTVIGWTNDGEIVTFRTVQDAYDSLREDGCLDKDVTFKTFEESLGTSEELCAGTTFFRYDIDKVATTYFNEALEEAPDLEEESHNW